MVPLDSFYFIWIRLNPRGLYEFHVASLGLTWLCLCHLSALGLSLCPSVNLYFTWVSLGPAWFHLVCVGFFWIIGNLISLSSFECHSGVRLSHLLSRASFGSPWPLSVALGFSWSGLDSLDLTLVSFGFAQKDFVPHLFIGGDSLELCWPSSAQPCPA